MLNKFKAGLSNVLLWSLTGLIAASGAMIGNVGQSRAAEDATTLRSVAVVYRHGTISPKYNPPKVEAEWPMGFKQLTAVGIKSLYQEGQNLRRRYVDETALLKEYYDSSEVFVRASNTDRSLQSAQTIAFGLFPLGTGPDPSVFDNKLEAAPSKALAFTPVPVHSISLNDDSLLRPWTGQANCTRYRQYVKKLPRTDGYKKQAVKYKDFLERMASVTGYNEGEAPTKILYKVNEIYEPLSSMVQHKMKMPEGISAEDIQLLSDLSDWNYHYQFLGKGVGRLTGGTFVGEVIDNFSDVATDGPRDRKLYIYSAHQRTVLGIEAALGLETFRTEGDNFRGRVPPLSSHYAFELHETGENDFAVRVKFVLGDEEKIATLPECGQAMCPLPRFVEIFSPVVPANWRQECEG